MHSSQVFDLLEAVAATPSKLEKESLLRGHAQDSELRNVLMHALSPTVSFGMKALPARLVDQPGGEVFDEQTWNLLERLRLRTLSGHAARDAFQTELDRLDRSSAELLGRIVRRDLRAGFSASTVNKAIKGLIPEYPYMRCSLPKDSNLHRFDWAAGVYSQIKADGMFCNVTRYDDSEQPVALRTRSGNDIPLEPLGDLVEALEFFLGPARAYQGELVVYAGAKLLPRKAGNGLLNSVLKGGALPAGHRVVFEAWDTVPLSAFQPDGRFSEEYRERYRRLQAMMEETGGAAPVRMIETRIVYSFEEAVKHCREVLLRGLEGTILKAAGAAWRDGDSKDQVKLKIEAPCDLRVREILPGDEGKKNANRPGRLRCSSEDELLWVDINVKNEAMRDALEATPEAFLGGIVEVLFNDIMEPGASNARHCLYLPRLKNDFARVDKTQADTLERVYEQFEAAKRLESILAAK